jgi:hypothetical protein
MRIVQPIHQEQFCINQNVINTCTNTYCIYLKLLFRSLASTCCIMAVGCAELLAISESVHVRVIGARHVVTVIFFRRLPLDDGKWKDRESRSLLDDECVQKQQAHSTFFGTLMSVIRVVQVVATSSLSGTLLSITQ